MPINGILFDFDGTLTRPGSLNFEAIKKSMGCPSHYPILEYLETLTDLERSSAAAILEEMENEAALKSVPNEGAVDLLVWLMRESLPFGLVTRNSIQSVRIALASFKVVKQSDFAAIITRTDAPPKPDPKGLLLAAQRMHLEPHTLLFVGDYRFDVLAGTTAGMITVLLTNGYPSTLLPDDPKPQYEISRLRELYQILEINSLRAKLKVSGS
jgi:hydrogenase expression/formation protein HypE